MYAGADRLVRPEGSRAFAAMAPRDKVTSHCFDGLYHEIFNEQDPSAVYVALKAWLDQRAPV
jgi:alpha-beta hydrolase superfamily lysophospholipase